MNFRVELEIYLKEQLGQEYPLHTEKILKMFRKRINVLMKDSERRYQIWQANEKRIGDGGYFDGEINSLKDMKELLK